MNYSIPDYAWFLLIYAFLGWCAEVIFHIVTTGKFVNRGFLNGPVTPIYGFGMIILIFVLGPLSDHFILLFIGSFFLTSLLEFITGYVLEKLFDTKWWDYSKVPFNIKGYVCLSFSLVWGLAAVFMVRIFHPSIYKFVSLLNNTPGRVLLGVLLLYLLIDFIVTVSGIMKINQHIRVLNSIGQRLRLYSDEIGEEIYKGMDAAVKIKDRQKAKIAQLYEEYESIMHQKGFVHKRLEKAFPKIKEKIAESELPGRKPE